MSKFDEAKKKWLMSISVDKYLLKANEVFNTTKNEVLCAKCHKPIRILTWNDTIKELVYQPIDNCMCDCKRKINEEKDDSARKDRMKIIMNSDMYLRYVGEKFKDTRFVSLDPSLMNDTFKTISAIVESWCREYKPGNKGFLLYGDVGTGKTTLMACVRNHLIDSGYSCVFATMSQIVEDISKKVDSEQFSFNTYTISDVLMIDDLGADFSTANSKRAEYMNDIFFEIINYRYVHNLTTCYTSNLTRKQMMDNGIDKRALDRFVEMIPDELIMEGESLRGRV